MTDLLLLYGAFYTRDPGRPRAMAAAIRQGRFVPVGDHDEIRNLIRPGTRVIDLEGRRVLPGLSNAHFDIYDWALGRQPLPLGDAFSLADPNPLWGIHAAVTHQRRDGTPSDDWFPEPRLTVANGAWGCALGPALALGRAVVYRL